MADEKEARPNILFALADDASHFGCYGHKFVKTPCIDALASEGVRFDNAFTTNPKCAPSRASMLTGRHTWQLKEGCDHYGYFPEGFDVYPDLLDSAGYAVGFTGKGWAPGNFEHYGRTRNPAGPEYNRRRLDPPEGSDISDCDYAANFEDFLDHRKDDQPFCFWFGCHEPHRPYKYGESRKHGGDPEESLPPPYWPDEETVRIDMADYAFEISWFDRQLSALLAVLDKRGERDNTFIIVTSDNGAPFPRVKGQMYDDDFRLPFVICPPGKGRTGRVVKDLISFIDLAPTFLELAGLSPPAEWPGTSLLPLLSDSPENYNSREYVLMGRERHDLGREKDRGYPVRCLRTREYLYVWNLMPDRWPAGNPETGFTNCDSSPTKKRVLELKSEGVSLYFDLAFAKRPAEELYDIRKDPHCMNNLAAEREYEKLKDALKSILMNELTDSGDPRMTGGGEEFDSYEYTGEDYHSWKALREGRWKIQPF